MHKATIAQLRAIPEPFLQRMLGFTKDELLTLAKKEKEWFTNYSAKDQQRMVAKWRCTEIQRLRTLLITEAQRRYPSENDNQAVNAFFENRSNMIQGYHAISPASHGFYLNSHNAPEVRAPSSLSKIPPSIRK